MTEPRPVIRAEAVSSSDEVRRKFEVGDALYSLFTFYDEPGMPEEVVTWPVVKITERFVYVCGQQAWRRERSYRLSRAELETEGSAWSQVLREILYTRHQLTWPVTLVDSRKAEIPALTEA
jgi:hypothetical protein